jgi:hypothetical protein
MSFLARFQRKKEDPELARRATLLRAGRVGEAVLLGTSKDEANRLTVFYAYNIAGVEYESSQLLDSEQSSREDQYLPGSRVTMRYDPHWPANSVVV